MCKQENNLWNKLNIRKWTFWWFWKIICLLNILQIYQLISDFWFIWQLSCFRLDIFLHHFFVSFLSVILFFCPSSSEQTYFCHLSFSNWPERSCTFDLLHYDDVLLLSHVYFIEHIGGGEFWCFLLVLPSGCKTGRHSSELTPPTIKLHSCVLL